MVGQVTNDTFMTGAPQPHPTYSHHLHLPSMSHEEFWVGSCVWTVHDVLVKWVSILCAPTKVSHLCSQVLHVMKALSAKWFCCRCWDSRCKSHHLFCKIIHWLPWYCLLLPEQMRALLACCSVLEVTNFGFVVQVFGVHVVGTKTSGWCKLDGKEMK